MDWMDEIGSEENFSGLPEIGNEQDLDQWRVDRLGMITGSTFGKLVKTSKDGFILSTSKVASDLIYKIAWERLLKDGNIEEGLNRTSFGSAATNHGNDYEGQAILKYMESTKNKVDYDQNFIKLNDWIGGTPDGLIGKAGMIEIKCPYAGANHLKGIVEGIIYNPEYIYQIQGYLWITGRKWCDFVTYDPDLPEKFQLNIMRIARDEKMIEGIEKVLKEVQSRVELILTLFDHE